MTVLKWPHWLIRSWTALYLRENLISDDCWPNELQTLFSKCPMKAILSFPSSALYGLFKNHSCLYIHRSGNSSRLKSIFSLTLWNLYCNYIIYHISINEKSGGAWHWVSITVEMLFLSNFDLQHQPRNIFLFSPSCFPNAISQLAVFHFPCFSHLT